MKRDYELTFVTRIQEDDESLKAIVDRVRGWIDAGGGQVLKVDQWGRRRLAYAINKQREGNYVFMQIQLEPTNVAGIERNMEVTEDILRYLIVRPDEQ